MEERRRPSALGKRKTPGSPLGDLDTEEPGLQHAVKKLIRQAALELDSEASQSAAGSTPGEVPQAAGSISPFSQPTSRDKAGELPPLVPQNSGTNVSQTGHRESTSGPGAVFDAYPIPGRGSSGSISQQPILANGFGVTPTPTSATSTQSGGPPAAPTGQFSGSGGFQNGTGQLGNWAQNLPQGFTFPIDSSNPGAAYPPVQPTYTNQPQPLDPALEQMLSFLPGVNAQPGTGTENPAAFPEDFLSKVFSFSWDGANGTNGNNNNNGGTQGMDGFSAAGQAQQGQGQGQGMAQGGMSSGQVGPPGQPTWDGWHHGWMA